MNLNDKRKRRVIDLYFSEHKTYAEIAEIERISPRDIKSILLEEESKQRQHENDELEKQERDLSTKAYQLFSKGKKPIDVSIALNLRQPEVSRMYREYWKLKRMHKLDLLYEEIGDEGIRNVVKLCRLAKKEGKSSEQIVKLLDLVDENNHYGLAFLEKKRKWLIDEIRELEMKIQNEIRY